MYFNPFYSHGFSPKILINKYGIVHFMFKGSQVKCLSYDVFICLKIVFILANSADPDEMPPYASPLLPVYLYPE